MYDIIIIGAGPAGLTAGIYARRAGKSAVIFESSGIGGQIAQAGHIENYPACPDILGIDLSNAMYEQAEKLGCDFAFDAVTGIERIDGGFNVKGEYESHEAKTVIIATGAYCRHLGVEGEERLIGRGVSYCAVCDGAFYRNKEIIVVGGGNSALEDAVYLTAYAKKVTLIHRRDEFRADKAVIEEALKNPRIQTVMNARVVEIIGEDAVSAVKVAHNDGISETVPTDGIFIAVGREPKNRAFASLISLDESGYVKADERCLTTCDGIFVAGDCRTKEIRQLTTATSDGTVAALAAVAYLKKIES